MRPFGRKWRIRASTIGPRAWDGLACWSLNAFVQRMPRSGPCYLALSHTHAHINALSVAHHHTQVNMRIKFRDPQSQFYADGRVVAIHSPTCIEVGYRASSWSHPR